MTTTVSTTDQIKECITDQWEEAGKNYETMRDALEPHTAYRHILETPFRTFSILALKAFEGIELPPDRYIVIAINRSRWIWLGVVPRKSVTFVLNGRRFSEK